MPLFIGIPRILKLSIPNFQKKLKFPPMNWCQCKSLPNLITHGNEQGCTMWVAIAQLPAKINQSSHQANFPINPLWSTWPIYMSGPNVTSASHPCYYYKEASWWYLIEMHMFLLKWKHKEVGLLQLHKISWGRAQLLLQQWCILSR